MTTTEPDRLSRIDIVNHLPDLMTLEDYSDPPDQKKLRIRISVTDEGVDILGDTRYVAMLEELLVQLGTDKIDRMLCG